MAQLRTILISACVAALVSFAIVKTVAPEQAGSQGSVEAKKSETAYERVLRTQTLRCGYGISPPHLVQDPKTGELSGFFRDITEQIGKELGLKVEWTEEAGWGNFIEGLRTGRYDIFCSLQWPDEARTRYQALSEPVVYSLIYAYARVDDARFDGNLDAINDPAIKIPAIDGDIGMALAKNGFPEAGILTLPQTATVTDMLLSVKTGKADVIFLEGAMFAEFEKQNPGVLKKVPGVDSAFVFGARYGLNAGETQLRDMIDVALRKLVDNGHLKKMAQGYSEDYIVPGKSF